MPRDCAPVRRAAEGKKPSSKAPDEESGGAGDAAQRGTKSGESRGTVLIAAAVNLAIAVAKAVGGVLSGSSAMFSEATHSVADTVTEIMLLTALERSAKPADEDHPLGYARERYVWAMLASVATFVGGAVFSLYEGVHTLTGGEAPGDPLVSYVVLGLAFLLEGSSLLRGLHQVRGEAARLRRPLRLYLRNTPDTTVKAVVMEDSAALVGLALAAGGLLGGAVHRLRRMGRYRLHPDRRPAHLRGLGPGPQQRHPADRPVPAGRVRAAVRAELLALPLIDGVLDLVTIVQGPEDVLIAAKIDFRDVATATEIARACENAEHVLRNRFPAIQRVYLDPTPSRGGFERVCWPHENEFSGPGLRSSGCDANESIGPTSGSSRVSNVGQRVRIRSGSVDEKWHRRGNLSVGGVLISGRCRVLA